MTWKTRTLTDECFSHGTKKHLEPGSEPEYKLLGTLYKPLSYATETVFFCVQSLKDKIC